MTFKSQRFDVVTSTPVGAYAAYIIASTLFWFVFGPLSHDIEWVEFFPGVDSFYYTIVGTGTQTLSNN